MRGSSRCRVAFAVVFSLVAAVVLLLPVVAGAASTGEITGTVTSAAGGAAIEGIEACALVPSKEAGCASTNANGEYTISGLASGSYTVRFTVPDDRDLSYLTQYYDDKSSAAEAEPVLVTEGGTTKGIDARMAEGGQIAGRVISASGGAPLEGVEICALVGDQEGGCAITGANGEYTISGLASGSYTVKFLAPGYIEQYYNGKSAPTEAEAVSVTAGGTRSGIDAQMESSAIKPVNTKAPEVTGTPAVGEKLSCSDGEWANAPTAYTYKWLRDGVEIFKQTEDTYMVQEADEGQWVSCEVTASNTAGSDSSMSGELPVPIPGVSTGQIAGTVTSASGGAPIEGIEVCAEELPEQKSSGCVYTSSSGKYTISGLASGSYAVGFRSGDSSLSYVAQSYDGKPLSDEPDLVSVAAGVTRSGIDAQMTLAPGRITGTVLTSTPSSVPIEGIEVCALAQSDGPPEPPCTLTGPSGEYTLSGLLSGSYKLEFSSAKACASSCTRQNYAPQYYSGKSSLAEAESVSVTAGRTTSGIDAQMVEGGEITGTLTSAATGDLIDEEIDVCALTPAEYTGFVFGPGGNEYANCAVTSASGEYTIARLATGSYKVIFGGGQDTYAVQYYHDRSSLAHAESVSVSAGAVTSGIDAQLSGVGVAVKPVNVGAPELRATDFTGIGETLSCSQGSWEYTPTSYSYKWLREGVEIPGATAAEYAIGVVDAGHTIACEVTATNSAGSASVRSSGESVTALTGSAEGSTDDPSVPAEAADGPLSATASGGTGGVTVARYASDPVAAPSFGILGGYIQVLLSDGDSFQAVTFADCELGGGSSLQWWNRESGAWQRVSDETSPSGNPSCTTVTIGPTTSPDLEQLTGTVFASSANPTVVKPVNTEAPQLSGTATVGNELSCFSGQWQESSPASEPRIRYGYTWLRDGVPIAAETRPPPEGMVGPIEMTYTLTVEDEGDEIACKVTAYDSAGFTSATSNAVSVPKTMASGGEGSTSSASVPARATDGPISATASGGTGSVIVGDYESDPVGAPSFESAGQYIDVLLAPGSDFTSLTFSDCELGGGEHLSWYEAETNEWQPVSDETAPSGSPPCITVTIGSETTPDLAQMTGTVFGVALSPKSTSGSTGTTTATTGGGGGSSTSTTTGPTEGSGGVLGAMGATGSVSLDGTAITVTSSGKAQIKLTCPGTTTCVGTLKLIANSTTKKGKKKSEKAKTETIGTSTFSIPPGKTGTVMLTLTGMWRTLLSAAHGELTATLTLLKSSPSLVQTSTDRVHLVQRKAAKTKAGKKK